MKLVRAALLCLAALLPALCQPPVAPKSAYDKKQLEAYVRHLFLWPEQVTVTVSDPRPAKIAGMKEVDVTGSAGGAVQTETFLVSTDGSQIIRGTAFDINASPFAEDMKKLKTDLSPSMGTPGAQVVIVAFSDFQCQFCREEAKSLRANLLTTYPTQVRLYFKDFPIDRIHPWARPAAIAGRCVFKEKAAAFWDFHDWAFDKQAELTAENFKTRFNEFLTAKGLDPLRINRCFDSKATEPEIEKSIAEARAVKVDSTPTLFVNGRKLSGNVPWPNLKQIIDWELDYTKKTGTAAEKCCEIKLPSPLNP